MNAKLDQTTSIWMELGEISSPAAPSKNMITDVCVVGAGTAGMTTAYLILREGKSVVILDDGPCHGSRFDKKGHLLCGPANRDLETIPTPFEEGNAMAAELNQSN